MGDATPSAAASNSTRAVARVGLLGRICFIAASRDVIALPSASQRRLVALVAVHAGTTLRASLLQDVLGVNAGALRATVSRVRRLIGERVLCTDPVGYRLTVDTDAAIFSRIVADTDATSDGQSTERLARLDEALAMWHGPALDEFAEEPWASAFAAQWDELRCVAIERRAALLISHGRLGEAVALLTEHVAAHPLRDHPRGLLMLALAGDGRQADALRAYHDYRNHLVEHIGTEPSVDVRLLERQIACEADGDLDPIWPRVGRPPAAPVAIAGSDAPTTNLPVFRSNYIGGDRELIDVIGRLRRTQVVTLVGEGGVGKTRLASRVGDALHAHGQRIHFVDLGVVLDGNLVPASVAAAVGSGVATDAIAARIGAGSFVLILDSCEHVVDAVADLVDVLTRACPGLRVLITSRQAVGLDGEHVTRLRPLDPKTAGSELLLDRVESAGVTLRPDQRDDVETICRRLDGNPLAIELVAPRVAVLGLRSVIANVADLVGAPTAIRRGAVERHRTLHATVDWSYRLLSPREQAVFRALGVFSGGFELDAVEHVTMLTGLNEQSTSSMLVTLVDRSMVVAEPGVDVTRFRLLETLRAFALAELARHGEVARVTAAHAAWVASITDVAMVDWMTAAGHRGSLRLERELDNWCDALAYAAHCRDAELAARLCGPPSALLVWGRPDLDHHLDALEAVVDRADLHCAALVLAAWGPAWARFEAAELWRVADRFDAIVPDDRSGISAAMSAAALLASGDIVAATAVRAQAIADARMSPGGRDFATVAGVYGACFLGARELIDEGWVRRTIELAERSDVPAVRALARIGLAWLVMDTDPHAASTYLHEVLADPEPLPAFFRRLTVTCVSRMLTSRSPRSAATDLLEVLPDPHWRGRRAPAIVLVTAAGLVATCDHDAADDIVATLAVMLSPRYLSTVVPDHAERARRGRVLPERQMVAVLRAAVEDIAGVSGREASTTV